MLIKEEGKWGGKLAEGEVGGKTPEGMIQQPQDEEEKPWEVQ